MEMGTSDGRNGWTGTCADLGFAIWYTATTACTDKFNGSRAGRYEVGTDEFPGGLPLFWDAVAMVDASQTQHYRTFRFDAFEDPAD
eukprot:scaffold1156_cov116-Pinguiococcus_pyrenoidosus.AAC.1